MEIELNTISIHIRTWFSSSNNITNVKVHIQCGLGNLELIN